MNKGKFERLDLQYSTDEVKASAELVKASFERVDAANLNFRMADQERKAARVENSQLKQQFAAELDTQTIDIAKNSEEISDESIEFEGASDGAK